MRRTPLKSLHALRCSGDARIQANGDEKMRPEGVRNPYAPPVAPVVDERLTDERGKRPLPVALAVGALGLYVLMSVLPVVLRGPPPWGPSVTPMAQWAAVVLFVSGSLGVGYQVALGQHWARVITLLGAITEVVSRLRAVPPLGAAGPLQWMLDFESVPIVVAACLLFLAPGRQWFRRRPRERGEEKSVRTSAGTGERRAVRLDATGAFPDGIVDREADSGDEGRGAPESQHRLASRGR